MEDKKEYTADDFLRSVREAKIEMRRCEYRMEELRSQCEKTTPGYGGTVVGGSGDDHKDSLMIAMAEHVTKLRGKAEAYIRRVMLAEDFIDTLPEPRQRIILRLRYIDLLKWEDVLTRMKEYGLYYERRRMLTLHGAALAEARRRFAAFEAEHPEIAPKGEMSA